MSLELSGKRVLVVGLGRSGTAVAILCAARGASVTVTDKRGADVLGPALSELPRNIKVEIGGHQARTFLETDLIVLSPGVPEIPELAAARAAGVAITGELELSSRYIDSTMIAITGTNGKSTTTTLAGAIARASGRPTFVGGNLGEPLALAVGTPAGSAGGTCVVEVSSFQLETTESFSPRVAVLLNITPDHLDRYHDLEHYAATKGRIFAAQHASDFAVVNLDDPLALRQTEGIRARRLGFSLERQLIEGAWLEGDELVVRLPGARPESYPTAVPALVGRHNQANALAALLASRLVGATHAEALRALTEFQPLAHRMELVAKAGGVLYYDDSKGTNVGAVVAALDGFPRPVVLIAGGRDKGGDYAPLAEAMRRVGRGAVLIGEAADKLEAALSPVVPVVRASTMDDAVIAAAGVAQQGDAVVLSPACSSFDMFRDYAHRAQVFRAAVERLAVEEAGGIG
ncbi:MAG TPA: UDP-N-acetylmuramoyl-L-alanine--D-glutamate ligase, partial [Polyangia bacterium]|jgi:UDP-N-acetylmuramoylalanine--D-glutamate ligase|nr:UDP-N-acetylmuramoyl-L-alanine--D-glutamate ligase [Polyangia bacterium]